MHKSLLAWTYNMLEITKFESWTGVQSLEPQPFSSDHALCCSRPRPHPIVRNSCGETHRSGQAAAGREGFAERERRVRPGPRWTCGAWTGSGVEVSARCHLSVRLKHWIKANRFYNPWKSLLLFQRHCRLNSLVRREIRRLSWTIPSHLAVVCSESQKP